MAGAKNGRTSSGRDNEHFRQRLDDLGKRIGAARGKTPASGPDGGAARGQAMGQALKLATELFAGVAVGGFIGWAFDRWLGTAPWLMVVFLVLGAAAGILNLAKSAQRMQREAGPLPGKDLPPDDDDD